VIFGGPISGAYRLRLTGYNAAALLNDQLKVHSIPQTTI
jgi:hypothetical protein